MYNWIKLLKSDVETFNAKIEALKESERTMLIGQNLSGLDLSHAKIRRCDLTNANLSDCKVEGYQLSTCRLQGTLLDNISFVDEYWRKSIEHIQLLWNGASEWNLFRSSNQLSLLNNVCFSSAVFLKKNIGVKKNQQK